MRRNPLFRFPLGDIVSTDVEEAHSCPMFSHVERDTRKRVAVGTRKNASVLAYQRGKKDEFEADYGLPCDSGEISKLV
jgi:hypothetical protein